MNYVAYEYNYYGRSQNADVKAKKGEEGVLKDYGHQNFRCKMQRNSIFIDYF